MPRLRVRTAPRRAPASAASAAKNTSYKIGLDLIAATASRRAAAKRAEFQPFKLPEFPPGAAPPKGSPLLAMDETPLSTVTSWAAQQAISSAWSEGLQFLGYTYLSELSQRPEYRVMSEVMAEEMTRKWIRFQGKGDDDKTDKISELTDYLDDMKLQAIFHHVALTDGLMGRAHIYIDTGDRENEDEMQTALGNGRDKVSRSKVKKGKLRGFRVIEPIWAYPLTYNSSDPLADNWYRPDRWYCMSRAIHRSRLLTFVGRPVPDVLKPAYAFGGLALSQIAKPYVDNWLRTRQSVSDLIHSFTVFKLGTDLSALLMDGGDQLFRRMELFNNLRDNNNLFLYNEGTENFDNTSAPLGTLDALLNKSQEQMAAVSRIPLVKLLGVSPGGLNASSEGEIVTFYDTIEANQNRLFRPHLTTCIDFAQISLWGEVDPDIVFVFEPLRALSRKEEAEVRKTDAETGQILVNGGAISQEEERIRIASDPDTLYQGLDPNDVPDLQEEEEGGLAIPGAGGAEKAILEGPGGEGGGDKPKALEDKSKGKPDKPKAENDKKPAKDGVAGDSFNEADHERRDDGKFGSGSGGGTAERAAPATKPGNGAIGRAREFLKSTNLRATVRTIAGTLKANQRAILAAAVVAAITKVAGGYITPELEEMISHEVTTFAEKSGVAVAKARELMQAVATKLVESRSSTAKDSAEPDDVLETITRFRDGFGAADKGEFKESDHPRKDDGKFGSGGGGSAKKQDAPAKAQQEPAKQGAEPAKAALVPAALKQPWAKETTVDKEGNVRTSNVNDAARALYEGRKVDLEQPRTVSTLIEHLGDVTKHMIALGEDAPRFNLCSVSVKGSNVFCTNNKGIPRIQMPQLDEEQTKAFRKHLKEKGYKVEKTAERASFLRATQNELLGWKVAKQAAKIEANDGVMDKRIVVSRDNYILDGHHHWAGQIGYDAKSNGKLGKLKTKISRVDISILDLLREADEFTGGKGKKGAGIGDKAIAVDSAWDDDDDWACDAAEFKESDHPRKEDGKFGSGGGGVTAKGVVKAKAAEPAQSWETLKPSSPTHEEVRKVANTIAAKMGFNEYKIHLSEESPTFELNGQTMFYAGAADTRERVPGAQNAPKSVAGLPGEITLFLKHLSPESVAGVTAHEIEHQKFQAALDAYRSEKDKMMKDPGPAPDPAGEYWWQREGGTAAMMSPDGSLKGEYATKYPIYTAMHKALDSVDISTFEIGDGVSSYSFEYWKGYKMGTCSRMSAMHETLAEMARIQTETGSLPEDHLGEKILAYRGAFKVTQATIAKGKAAWRRLFKTIDKLYPKVKR